MSKKLKSTIIALAIAVIVLSTFHSTVYGYEYQGKIPQYGIDQIENWKKIDIYFESCGPFYIYRNSQTGQIGYIHDCDYGGKRSQFGYITGSSSDNWIHEGNGIYSYMDKSMSWKKMIHDWLMEYISRFEKISLLNSFAFLNNINAQPNLSSYTFRFDEKEYTILLPENIPYPPENAQIKQQMYFPSPIILVAVQYMQTGEHPVAAIWLTNELGVFGLVFHYYDETGNKVHKIWLYVDGIPVPATGDQIQDKIDKLYYSESPE